MNPDEQSYRRLGEKKAPKYISWSPENRSQLIRIPAAKGEYRRIELRSPDPLANPYIAYAGLIYAGLAYTVFAIISGSFTLNAAMLSDALIGMLSGMISAMITRAIK